MDFQKKTEHLLCQLKLLFSLFFGFQDPGEHLIKNEKALLIFLLQYRHAYCYSVIFWGKDKS